MWTEIHPLDDWKKVGPSAFLKTPGFSVNIQVADEEILRLLPVLNARPVCFVEGKLKGEPCRRVKFYIWRDELPAIFCALEPISAFHLKNLEEWLDDAVGLRGPLHEQDELPPRKAPQQQPGKVTPEVAIGRTNVALLDENPDRQTSALARVDHFVAGNPGAFHEVAALLYEVCKGQLFKKLPIPAGRRYERFSEYVSGHLKREPCWAWNMVKIHKTLVLDAKLSGHELDSLGSLRASRLATLPREERTELNLGRWISMARSVDLPTLESRMRSALSRNQPHDPNDDELLTRKEFLLAPGQLENVNSALELCGRITGSRKPGHSLDMIALSFSAERNERAEVKLERVLQSVERVYPIQLIAIRQDGDDMEIIHGEELAKKMLAMKNELPLSER
jgi:hypothetical protein